LGTDLVAGKNLVPNPATGKTALVTGRIADISLLSQKPLLLAPEFLEGTQLIKNQAIVHL